jgi:hypothetical protein
MAKLIGLLLMVGIVWVGMEVYNEGPDRAFGGAFSFLSSGKDLPDRVAERVSTPKRVGARVELLMQEGAARYEKLVDP